MCLSKSIMWAYFNGKRVNLPEGRAHETLLEFVRDDLGLTGAKLGCGEGGCGACTVMVSRRDPSRPDAVQHRSINACLAPLYSVAGCHVITVEGIGSTKRGLHPVQARLAKAHGSQCGFCTPGFVMSMYALLRSKNGEPISEEDIEENLAGNLCRCTGYRPILDAFRPFASMYSGEGEHGAALPSPAANGSSGVCPTTGRPCDCSAKANGCGSHAQRTELVAQGEWERDRDRELITPPEVLQHVPDDACSIGDVANWYRPVTLESLLKIKTELPEAKIVAGNTEVGIEMRFKHAAYRDLVYVGWVPELAQVVVNDEAVSLGAGVSLATLMETCRVLSLDGIGARVSAASASTSPYAAIAEQLKWFAGPPIRNWGTIGGNIVTASPISDLNPLWIASRAVFMVQSQARGAREVPASSFFLGYREVDMAPDEVLVRVTLPRSRPFEYVKEFKQAQRRDDDIAIVNCGFRVAFRFDGAGDRSGQWVIDDVCIAYGGVAPSTVTATETADVLRGKALTEELVEAALASVAAEIRIPEDAPGGRAAFRRVLVSSFLRKGLAHAARALERDSRSAPGSPGVLPYDSLLGLSTSQLAETFHREPSKGIQYFSETGEQDIVGSPAQHASAAVQVSGEARYVDDMPRPTNMLHAALILSEKAHAVIKSIDCTEARSMSGVEAIHFASDIPGKNSIGPVLKDEEVFATSTVTCVGYPIGVVTARTRAEALRAARAVRIVYEELEPVLSIQQAIAKNSFYGDEWGHPLDRGDVDAVFEQAVDASLVLVEGSINMGGQEHFYLEPNAHVVAPVESGELVSYSSTQCPQKHQQYIASVLGVQSNRVVVRTKRIGGGFGGKETRAAFLNTIAAVPAFLLDKPVSLVVDRDVDMSITGHRHPFFANYRAACTPDGVIQAVDVQLYSNGGNSLDLSGAVMDRALLSLDSVYSIPNVRARGTVCKTNMPSNTAFRGFGAPQGMMVIESIVERLSAAAGIDQCAFVERNMIKTGDMTHYGQVIQDCQARRCWEDALASAGGLEARRQAVDEFNAAHTNRKRGIAVTPTKFGISFTLKFLNQAGAIIHIYQGDGSVLVSHGGVEMGQGLHTKVCQIVAHDLGVPLETVHISETATDKVPNATPTAASASSDLYGAAAADACAQLNARLAPYRQDFPDASFLEIVQKAYFDRVDLSAHGFYATPDITSHPHGNMPFDYYTYGTAVTEVELDATTGDWHAIRSDVVMDVGQSLNPAIDIGQVEGAFVQGMGWSCIEELTWGDEDHPWVRTRGSLFSCGPGTYKIPTANDIPIDFRVSLLRDSHCHRTPLAHSSKASGEPPFFLGTSVFWALKDAVKAYRAQERGDHDWFRLDLPASAERLALACMR